MTNPDIPNLSNEERRLINPAFCASLIRNALDGYAAYSDYPLRYPLTFLVLPLVLHRRTRESMPPNARTPMLGWIHANPFVRVGLADRAASLVPFTQRGLTAAFSAQLILHDEGGLRPARKLYRQKSFSDTQATAEVTDCLQRAALIGRWFARSGSATNVYISFGVRP